MKMTESPNLEEMESAYYLDGESEKEGVEKISVSQQSSNIKSDDNYVVDMERFSHFIHEKDMSANSRITLQKNLSRKGLARGEKKFNSTTANERDATRFTTSPKGCTPEKPIIVGLGSTDNSTVHHHQITITSGSISTTNNTESKFGRKRLLSFRRSHSTFIDPKMILLFFATLSSMGTILLIYFTLSMTKLKDDDDGSTVLN
ncbi:hypothetical protein ACJIZ3_006572 [Penstemon smallii]|uniref:Transmembrane protein n=1 Tax=Penstemon smallii TaxID=265156 RepID=A0ABD3S866_9LAMI